MPWLTLTPIIIWALIFIPLLVFLWYVAPDNKLYQILSWLAFSAANIYFFLAVNWAIANYYLRFLPLAFSLAILIRWQKPFRNTPFLPEWTGKNLIILFAILVVLGLVGFVDFKVLQAANLNDIDTTPMPAFYPVRTGWYVIANGGNGVSGWAANSYVNNWLGRPTQENEEMTYAVDIFELRTSGKIADRTLSKDFREYEIFNEQVYSPCLGLGEVVYVEDGHPELTPMSPGSGIGNNLVIQCTNLLITLSNLRNGSISVEVGEQISPERMVALVGSTAENRVPHIHMHVTTLDGEPVPIVFDKYRFLIGWTLDFVTRNDLFIR